MRIRATADRAFSAVMALLLLPARAIEEGIHAAVAWPVADRVSVNLNPWGNVAKTRVKFRADAPGWWIRLAQVAPELLAAATGAVVLAWWLVVGGSLPDSTIDWALLYFVGLQYLAVVAPEQTSGAREGSDE